MLGHQRQGNQGSESVYLHFGLGYLTIRNRQCALQNPGAGMWDYAIPVCQLGLPTCGIRIHCNEQFGFAKRKFWIPHSAALPLA